MFAFMHNAGNATAAAVIRACTVLSGLRRAIREARDLEARLSGHGYPVIDC
jgi:hypothetical protein